MWSWAIVLSICQNEFCHGRNRRRAHECQLWGTFTAHSFNQEQLHQFKMDQQALGVSRRNIGRRALVDVVDRQPRKKRNTSPFEQFRLEAIHVRKAQGQKLQITSAAFREELSQEWQDIIRGPPRYQRYVGEAELANASNARANDEVASSLARVPLPAPAGSALALSSPLSGPNVLAGSMTVVGGAAQKVLGGAPEAQWPTSVSLLRHVLAKQVVGGVVTGISHEEQEKAFHRDHGHFTNKVEVSRLGAPPQPRWAKTPAGATQARRRVEAGLTSFLLAACHPQTPKTVPHKHLLVRVCVDCGDDDPDRKSFYFSVASGNRRAGSVPLCVRCIDCEVVGFSDSGDLLLQLARRAHVKTRRALPFGGAVKKGMFRHSTHWDIASAVIDGAVVSGWEGLRFTMDRLSHKPVRGDMFQALGE